ncbi:ABC transporter permease [Eoetvoesiella caeni]
MTTEHATLPRRNRIPRGLWLPLFVVAAVELWFVFSNVESTTLAPPSKILPALADLLFHGDLLEATGQTLAATAAGLTTGSLVGLILGIVLGLSRTTDRLLEVTLEVCRPVPPVALIPIALMVFGFGYRLEASIISFGAIWPVLILTRGAIASIEPQLTEYAALLRLSFWSKITKIILPAIVPQIFVAIRLSAGISLILAVTVEITINPIGLGSGIMTASMAMNPARMLAYLVWIGLIGISLNASLLALQKRHFSYGTTAGAAA